VGDEEPARRGHDVELRRNVTGLGTTIGAGGADEPRGRFQVVVDSSDASPV